MHCRRAKGKVKEKASRSFNDIAAGALDGAILGDTAHRTARAKAKISRKEGAAKVVKGKGDKGYGKGYGKG